jgi:adenine-specific DNA methylase
VDIQVGDFFSIEAAAKYDAVIGNPPYIRYQDYGGEARRLALRRALEHGVRLTRLSSSWAAFVVHAAEFLRPGGRLGLVVPGELLAVKYAAEVRRFLLRRFGRIRLVTFDELVFPGVQEEIVLLLAEGEGPSDHFEVYQARRLEHLPSLDTSAWSSYYPDEDGKWIPALIPTELLEIYRDLVAGSAFERLMSWGNTYLGAVSGNNQFFALSKPKVQELGLQKSELLAISPPGSRHLRSLTFTECCWRALREEARRVYLFNPGEKPSEPARKYIRAGEALGVNEAYKCSSRSPWWRVPLVAVPHMFLTYMDRDRPRLVTNRVRVHHLNSVYGVRLQPGRTRLGMDLLPLAVLNSVTMLGAEIVGRAYGGGILKLEPREADALPVPSFAVVQTVSQSLRRIKQQVSVALRQGDLAGCVALVDRVILTAGLGPTTDQIQALWAAREILFRRRAARANGF